MTPFPGSTFIARLAELTDDSGYFVWEGTIVSGGTGTVSISAFHEDDVLRNVEIEIDSDAGNFGIGETRHGQWYYVIEANPHYRLPELPVSRRKD